MARMALKPLLSLSDLVQKHKNDTHHIRLKVAPEMFRLYCQKMKPIEAENLVCELLQITHQGFEYAIRKDPLSELHIYKRNQTILDLRCDGFSFASISKTVKLSRVQVWRILEAYREQIDKIAFLETRKIRNTRLKYPDLDKIEALRKKLKDLKPKNNLPKHTLSTLKSFNDIDKKTKKGSRFETPTAQVYQ